MQADNRLPRYQRLRDELASKIAERRWQPGEAIPTEQQLAQSFGAKALGQSADGLMVHAQARSWL